MFKTVRKFKDKDGRIYDVGDVYPHTDAKKPTNARIKVLYSTKNKYNQIYIEQIEEEKADK